MEQRPMRENDRPDEREMQRGDMPERDRDRADAVRENDLDRRENMRDVSDGRDEREPMWSGIGDIRRRFDELQVQFVEEPRKAVEKAEELVKLAVDQMANSMHERLNGIHGEMGDGTNDTERLRRAMQGYRRMIDSFDNRTAA
jgi:hypothetical protein